MITEEEFAETIREVQKEARESERKRCAALCELFADGLALGNQSKCAAAVRELAAILARDDEL